MSIRPTSSGQTPRPALERTGKSDAANAPARSGDAQAQAAPAGVRGDAVQISAQARELQMSGADAPVTGAISADRLKSVSERMTNGFYERPQVRDAVLGRLAKDL